MSNYCFIAADRKLPPLAVGFVEQGSRIFVEDESRLLNIFENQPNAHTRTFSDKPVLMGLEFGRDFSKVADALLTYLQKALMNQTDLEIWWTWLEETDTPERRTVALDALTTADLQWLLGGITFEHTKVLKIYRSQQKMKGR